MSVRARAYSSIMVNPLVIEGNTRNIIVYNISIINCSCERSIYCLEIDSKLLRERLITFTVIGKKLIKINSLGDWEYRVLKLNFS